MAFGLRLAGLPKAEIETRVARAAAVLELGPYLDRKPSQLSGGQRQRVAMGRAIVREPDVFLFDEPLSNLDAKLRNQMRIEIKRLQRPLDVTTIYVTHDQVEAMTLADRIVVMKDGLIAQIGTPFELYRRSGRPVRRRLHRRAGDDLLFGAHRGEGRRAAFSFGRLRRCPWSPAASTGWSPAAR